VLTENERRVTPRVLREDISAYTRLCSQGKGAADEEGRIGEAVARLV
jgi:hypothetical protein